MFVCSIILATKIASHPESGRIFHCYVASYQHQPNVMIHITTYTHQIVIIIITHNNNSIIISPIIIILILTQTTQIHRTTQRSHHKKSYFLFFLILFSNIFLAFVNLSACKAKHVNKSKKKHAWKDASMTMMMMMMTSKEKLFISLSEFYVNFSSPLWIYVVFIGLSLSFDSRGSGAFLCAWHWLAG